MFGKRSAPVDVTDDIPPRLTQVTIGEERTQVVASFSKPLDPASATAASHYRLDADVVPRSAVLSPDGRTVSLAFANEVRPGKHTLHVAGIADATRVKNLLMSGQGDFLLTDTVVTTARTDKEWSDLPMGAPAADDYADLHSKHGVSLAAVPGFAAPQGGETGLQRLLDGVAASSDDDTGHCAWMDGPGRMVMDLAAEVPVTSVRIFSWHKSDRAPQRFVLYGARDATLPDAASAVPGPPWERIAAIDTVKLGQGGKHASAVVGFKGKAIGTYRWLLWVLEPVANGGTQGTFLTEVDVTVAK